MNVTKLSKDLAQAATIKSPDDLNGELDRFKVPFEQWFAKQTCWPDKEPQKSLAKIQVILHLPGALARPDTVLHLITFADLKPGVIARRDWPFPIQSSLNRIGISGDAPNIHSYINLFEAMMHLHFVVLASQFFWSFEQLEQTEDEHIKRAVSTIYHALTSNTSGGGYLWAHWSAILSAGCAQLQKRGLQLPFPELSKILEPDQLTFNQKMTQDKTLACEVAKGGAAWDFCTFMVKIRNEMFHWESLSRQSLDNLKKGLSLIVYTLGALFKPYNRLMLAMVDERQAGKNSTPHQGIACCWEGTELVCATNDFGRDQLQQWWNRSPAEGLNHLPAPAPPDKKYRWDESILLFDPDAPYERNLYLMPLGFRFGHAAARKDSTPAVPGLINTVRWQRSRVKAIVQRSYSGEIPSAGTFTSSDDLPDGEATRSPSALDFIQRIILGLKKYGFEPPRQSISLSQQELLFEFDLAHHQHAARLLKNSVSRPGEIQRVLESLHQSPEQKMFLEGISGSGKSILMAQLYQELSGRAVFLSFDCRIEPMEDVETGETGRAIQTIAVPVRMHYLTVLCKLTGTPPPSIILSSGEVQSRIAGLLEAIAKKQSTPFYILIDGLNQTLEPTAPFVALPDPLPSNLFILTATQPQEHIRKQVSSYGRKKWNSVNLKTMVLGEARTLVNNSWNPKKRENIPNLPDDIIEKLWESSNGLPIFLDFWGNRLRQLYQGDIKVLADQARDDFAVKTSKLFPKELALRFEEITANFIPQNLPRAIFWILVLVTRSLTITEILQGINSLKDNADYPILPVSAFDVEQCLSILGGFLQSEELPNKDPHWRLGHEMLGKWFIERFGTPGSLRSYRFNLAFLGARQLFKTSSQKDAQWWIELIRKDNDNFYNLPTQLLVETLEELCQLIEQKSDNYILALSTLSQCYLFLTGDIAMASANLEYFKNATTQPLKKDIKAKLFKVIGEIYMENGCFSKAKSYFDQSLEIYYQLVDEIPTPRPRRDLADTLARIGDYNLNREISDLGHALRCYEQSLEIKQQLADETPTPQALRDLSYGLNRVGGVYEARNEFDQAMRYYEQSLEIRLQLVDGTPTPLARVDLSYGLNRVGGVYEAKKEFDQAMRYYEQSLEISLQLVDETPTPKAQVDLLYVLNRVGDIYEAKNELDKALRCFEQCMYINQQLVDKQPTVTTRENSLFWLKKNGDVYKAKSDFKQALRYHEQCLKIIQQLVNEEPKSVEACISLIFSLGAIGNIHKANNHLEQALHYFEQSQNTRQQIINEAHSLYLLSSRLKNIGKKYQKYKCHEQALECYEMSLAILQQRVDESPTPGNFSDLSNALKTIANFYKKKSNFEQALYYLEKSQKIIQQVFAQSPTDNSWLEFVIILNNISEIHKTNNNFEKALEYSLRELEITQQFVKKSHDNKLAQTSLNNYAGFAYNSLPGMLNNIGEIYKTKNNFEKALHYFEQSIEISQQWVDETRIPNVISVISALKVFAITLCKISCIHEAKNDYDQALCYFKKSLQIKQKMVKLYELANIPSLEEYHRIRLTACMTEVNKTHEEMSAIRLYRDKCNLT